MSKVPQMADVPLWAVHAVDDPVVPYSASVAIMAALEAAGVRVTRGEWAGDNSAGPAQDRAAEDAARALLRTAEATRQPHPVHDLQRSTVAVNAHFSWGPMYETAVMLDWLFAQDLRDRPGPALRAARLNRDGALDLPAGGDRVPGGDGAPGGTCASGSRSASCPRCCCCSSTRRSTRSAGAPIRATSRSARSTGARRGSTSSGRDGAGSSPTTGRASSSAIRSCTRPACPPSCARWRRRSSPRWPRRASSRAGATTRGTSTRASGSRTARSPRSASTARAA